MDEVFSVNSKELCNSAVDVIPKGRVFQLCDYFEQLAVNHEENVPLIAKNSNLNKSHASENLNQDTQTQIFLCNTLGFFPPENTSSCVKRNYTFPVLATPTTALNSIKDRFSSIEPLLTFLFSQHPSSTWKHPIPITGLEKNSGPFVTCYVVSNEATERALKKASRTSVPLKDKLRSWFTFKIIPNYFKKSVPLLNLSSKKVASYLTSKDAQYWYQIQVYLLSSREQNHNATVLKEMAQVYNRLYCRTKELLLCTGILVNVRARHTQKLIEICETLLKAKNYASFLALTMAVHDFHKTRPYLLQKKDLYRLDKMMGYAKQLQIEAKDSEQEFSLPFVTPYMRSAFPTSSFLGTFGNLKSYWNLLCNQCNAKELEDISSLFSTIP